VSALDDRAMLIKDYVMYRFLQQLPGVNMAQLCMDLNLTPTDRTRRAINRARIWLAAEGYLLPAACPNAGQLYKVTRSGADVLEPALWLDAVDEGVERTSSAHWQFAQAHPEGLSELDRALVDMRVGQIARRRQETEEFRRVLEIIRTA